MQYLFVTTNQNKVKELQQVLEHPLKQVEIELPEIQAVDVHDVIEAKAKAAFAEVGQTVLVEDTSLSILAWNGLPGALIAWFLKSVDVHGICAMLNGFECRRATAETCIGYYDGETFAAFCGKIEGVIADAPRGTHGFGWDPIFIPDGSTKTFAELAAEGKILVSMRTDAALQLKAYLQNKKI